MATRVIHVVNGLEVAGAERTMLEIARSLPAEEFDVSVLVVRDGPLRGDLDAAGLSVEVVGGDFDWRWPQVVMKMARHMREAAPDIVHTHLIGSDIVGGLAARLANVPVILSTQHDTIARQAVYGMFRRYSSRWLSAVVPVAPSMIDYCRRELHIPDERIHPIENAVDASRFRSGPAPRHQPLTFGCIGRLVPLKGHDVVVRALAHVRKTIPDARLLLAGDGPERARLGALSEELRLGDAVSFLGAVEDIPAFLDGVDIFVHPSLQEGLPLAILEAMAASKPIVASNLAAVSQATDDDRCGRLFPAGDSEACAAEMLMLAADEPLAGRLAASARERAQSHYSPRQMGERYAALYQLLLGTAGTPDVRRRDRAGTP